MNKMIIGENAGKVWRFLSDQAGRKCEFHEIGSALQLADCVLAAAIGWLAREDKVEFEFVQQKDGTERTYVYLMPNVYF